MKIESLTLSRFKKFQNKEIPFDIDSTDSSSVVTAIVGSNGSGKSSILQSIAAVVGTATRRLKAPSSLEWAGFNSELLNSAWPGPSEVKVTVRFTDQEITSTLALFEEYSPYIENRVPHEPAAENSVRLTLKNDKVTAKTAAQLFQFRGREYARFLFSNNKESFDVFEKVGSCLWYTESRTSTSLTPEEISGELGGKSKQLQFDEQLLRRQMNALFSFHSRVKEKQIALREGQRDIIQSFEKYFKLIFPSRGLVGTTPRKEINQVLEEAWFNLKDDAREYEISEMSGAERALFPILFDFANWNINNSIVLIDEVELHLHPPLQQRFISALPKLGKNNHFILTTHSDWVLEMLSPSQIIRLDGGDHN